MMTPGTLFFTGKKKSENFQGRLDNRRAKNHLYIKNDNYSYFIFMKARPDLRLTKQRKIILEEIQKVKSHPSANEIYTLVRRRLPRISLATVYRNLELLADHGLIQKLALAGSQRRFDGTVADHYHIRCLKCERVDDIALEPFFPVAETSAMPSGYQLLGHRLEFFGICPRCQERDSQGPQPRGKPEASES